MDYYLTYDHTTTNNGKNFYYLRSRYLPNGVFENLLVYFVELELDCDIFPFLEQVEPNFPREIPAGTDIYKVDGTAWTTPTDLYLLLIQDNPIADTISPTINDLKSSSPLAVYAEVPPSVALASDVPADVSPVTYPPNDPSNPGYYMPTGDFEVRKQMVVTDGGSIYVYAQWMDVCYDGCSLPIPPEGNHLYNNLDEHYVFWGHGIDWQMVLIHDSPAPYHAYTPCCNSGYYSQGFYVFEGYMHAEPPGLYVQYFRPVLAEPVAWYMPELLEEPDIVGGGPGIATTVGAGVVLLGAAVASWCPSLRYILNVSLLYGVAGSSVPFAGEAKALVTTKV